MVTIDPNLVILDVNGQMTKLTGVPKAMLIGSRFDRCFTEPERAAAGIGTAIKAGFVTNYDLTLSTDGIEEILVSLSASTFYDPLGEMRGIFAVARDVTEQRRIEQQLRDQQNYSRGLFESSIDALLAVDGELNIIDVNEQTIHLTGCTRDELTHSAFPSLFTDPERATEAVHRALAQGFVKDWELTVLPARGREVAVSLNSSLFKDAAGAAGWVLWPLATSATVGDSSSVRCWRQL